MTSTAEPTWVTVPCVNSSDAPLIGASYASVARKDSLYIFIERSIPAALVRGSMANRPSLEMYEFNFVTKEWAVVVADGVAPCQRRSHSAVVYKDSLFVFGGYDGDRRLNDFYSYNFLTQTWTNVFVNAGHQPTSRYGHAAVVYDNAMYVFGGSDSHYGRDSASSRNSSDYGRSESGRHVNDMYSFNLETNTWSSLRVTGEVPYPREGASMVVYKESCLLYGGYDHDLGYLSDVHVYHFETRVWTCLETKGQAPLGCHRPLVTLLNNSLVTFGGQTDPNLYMLDLETNTWDTVAYAGLSPKSSSPAGCMNDNDLVILSEQNDVLGFQQLHLPEKKEQAMTREELEPDEDGSAVAHLRSLVNNPLMSDVTFMVEGEPIYSHKSLCVRCHFFEAMLTREMKESTAREIEITDVSRATFLAFLEYIYTDRIAVAGADLEELFIAADRYGCERLKRICAHQLQTIVSVDNVSSILQAADQHNCPSLRDKCFEFTLQNFDIVSKTESFVQMARTNIELALQILQKR
ncbi:hypothetical protein CCR75_000937 [Bremia lactucae]|uniref:BTB domain-containing protein n=1 Tax=Bremia lactucae TaxID=4779 RepID=A0A976FKN5_BRELC|nr:hypothetical protein CCR75_000937 [Bremia lactucae]